MMATGDTASPFYDRPSLLDDTEEFGAVCSFNYVSPRVHLWILRLLNPVEEPEGL